MYIIYNIYIYDKTVSFINKVPSIKYNIAILNNGKKIEYIHIYIYIYIYIYIIYIYIYIYVYIYIPKIHKRFRMCHGDSLYPIQAFQPSLEFSLKHLAQKLNLISKT